MEKSSYFEVASILESPDNTELKSDVVDDLKKVDKLIKSRFNSDIDIVNQLSLHIFESGGKRIRPLLVLISARAAGYSGNDHITLAVILELIHTATLLHDDVVDESKLRRGRETANAIWGNEASVLVGDFLYSKAFQIMVELGNERVLKILAEATNTLAEGEIMQLTNRRNPQITEERYLATIRNKTAKLFESAALLGAITADSNEEIEKSLGAFGKHLGTSFQLIDDALDYVSDANRLGKNIGDDLAEGKPTLPLLYAMWNGDKSQSKLIESAISKGGLEQLEKIIGIIEKTGGLSYTFSMAESEARKASYALGILSPSIYKEDLKRLLEFAVSRSW